MLHSIGLNGAVFFYAFQYTMTVVYDVIDIGSVADSLNSLYFHLVLYSLSSAKKKSCFLTTLNPAQKWKRVLPLLATGWH